ncbi:related to mechanosensitive ion channel [Phialocephala subalpina]|uniref:Related to mechanosensitive ion channel n=1 Tax=Phialocephala subalpina TaxID=576137 RepID=A0A1L7WVR9_9HELO|nr:related to mechanosensitive ion channel [Phialocephala subalpina]
MSLRSPRSPTDFSRRGFQPLPVDNSNNPDMSYAPPDQVGIPLTQVGTRSSSTGARKPGEGAISSTEFNEQPTFRDDEKKGLFKNRSKRAGGKRSKAPTRVGTDGEEISVNGLGRFYNKVINFSVVTRYLVYVAPVAILIAIPIVLFAVLRPFDLFINTGVRTYLFWTWIEIVWLSIWVSKLVSKAVPYIFMFLCGVVSSGTRKYAMILKAVEIPLSLVGWSVTSLVTFTALTSKQLNLDHDPFGWVKIMKQILGPCLIASILYLIEKMIIQLISINYHRRSFDGRIKDSKRSIHLLGLLFEASRTLFPMYCLEFRDEDHIISDSIEVMLGKAMGTPGHKRSGSATPMKLVGMVGGGIGRVGDKVTSVFGNIASEITGKQVFNPNSAHSVVVEALEKTRSSEALARRLWMSFVVEGKDALYQEDIEEVLGPARKDDAQEAFSALDNDGNGDISLDEMIMKVVEISRDRKAIAASMRDVGQAIGVLDQVLIAILFVIVVFIFVAFQDTNFVTTLATAGTTLLSLSFVFAATTQEFLGSCIFLFVKHPYDVGDRVDIVGPTQEFLVVEQISLLFTVFKRIDSMKMVQVPNIVLNNLWIENITRSKAMKEQLDMFISFDTSLEDIELLRSEMEQFVRHPDNSRDFQPDIILEATGIGSMDKMQLKIEIRHKSNWANEAVRAARRSKFMCALVLALRKVPIYGPGGGGEALGGATNPSYSVAVPDEWATEARDKAAKAKEGKRLVPTKKPDTKKSTGDLGSASEEKAAEALNNRRPLDDPSTAWGARDDVTLGSRDQSLDRQKSRDQEIEGLKQTLLKRESTRGRRKPGEHVPPMPGQSGSAPSGYPSMSLTPADERADMNFMGRMNQSLDEEAELGLGLQPTTMYQGGGLSNNPYQQAPQTGGYSMFPNRTASQSQSQSRFPVQPQQSGTTASSGQTTQQGQQQGRSRKLSLGFKNSSNAGSSE